MPPVKYHIHILPILLLALCGMHFTASANTTPTPDALFHGGCLTSGNQTVVIGTQPTAITATTATGGNCNGNYTYQWQISTDGLWYTNIPGSTGQHLTFPNAAAPVTSPGYTYYQRRATCGIEVKYTGFVKITWVTNITYYNVAKSGEFTRNNCGSGYTGSKVIYPVAAGTYSSTVSQAQADQLAQNDVNNNGQAYANSHGSCTPSTVQLNLISYVNMEFNARFVNTTTGAIYDFVFPAVVYNHVVGQIPRGTYNVIIQPQRDNKLYEWIFSNAYQAGTMMFIKNGMDYNCDCGQIEIWEWILP